MSFALAIILDGIAVTREVLNTRLHSCPLVFIRGFTALSRNYARIWGACCGLAGRRRGFTLQHVSPSVFRCPHRVTYSECTLGNHIEKPRRIPDALRAALLPYVVAAPLDGEIPATS